MSGVNVSAKPASPVKTIVPIAASVVGGMYGGPAGAAAGGKIGSDLVSGGPDPTAVETKQADTGAINRRIQSQDNMPSTQLAKADAALQQLPPEYQEKYGATIAAARQMDKQGGDY